MKAYALKVEQSGRILLPAEVRKRLGLLPGAEVVVHVDDEAITVAGSREAVLRQIQEELRPFRTGRKVVDELLAERRAEAKAEERS
jgi:AbrB family looped-hinge helix DNA binding protein